MASVAAQIEPVEVSSEGPAWESSEGPPLESYESPIAYEETPEDESEPEYVAEVSPEPMIEIVESEDLANEPAAFNPAWIDATISYPAPTASAAPVWQPEAGSEPVDAGAETPFWHELDAVALEPPLNTWTPVAEAPASDQEIDSSESSTWTPEPASTDEGEAPAETPAESQSESEAPSWEAAQPAPVNGASKPMLFGRVQVSISPVPDFDRLLNLDSALSRVNSVQTVTLADYAQEEVTFRIDLASPLDANDFAQQLGEAAGINTEVADANDAAVTLRVA
jgi:hypothetical protein